MPRIERVSVGDHIYHVINRANARVLLGSEDGTEICTGTNATVKKEWWLTPNLVMTIITDKAGNLVTSFPGLPAYLAK